MGGDVSGTGGSSNFYQKPGLPEATSAESTQGSESKLKSTNEGSKILEVTKGVFESPSSGLSKGLKGVGRTLKKAASSSAKALLVASQQMPDGVRASDQFSVASKAGKELQSLTKECHQLLKNADSDKTLPKAIALQSKLDKAIAKHTDIRNSFFGRASPHNDDLKYINDALSMGTKASQKLSAFTDFKSLSGQLKRIDFSKDSARADAHDLEPVLKQALKNHEGMSGSDKSITELHGFLAIGLEKVRVATELIPLSNEVASFIEGNGTEHTLNDVLNLRSKLESSLSERQTGKGQIAARANSSDLKVIDEALKKGAQLVTQLNTLAIQTHISPKLVEIQKEVNQAVNDVANRDRTTSGGRAKLRQQDNRLKRVEGELAKIAEGGPEVDLMKVQVATLRATIQTEIQALYDKDVPIAPITPRAVQKVEIPKELKVCSMVLNEIVTTEQGNHNSIYNLLSIPVKIGELEKTPLQHLSSKLKDGEDKALVQAFQRDATAYTAEMSKMAKRLNEAQATFQEGKFEAGLKMLNAAFSSEFIDDYLDSATRAALAARPIQDIVVGNQKSITQAMNKNQKFERLDVASFTIKPLQRVTKLPLLMREMVKQVPADVSQPIREDLQKNLAHLNDKIKEFNEQMRELELRLKVK